MVVLDTAQYIHLLKYKLLVLKNTICEPQYEEQRNAEIQATEKLIAFYSKGLTAEQELIDKVQLQIN